MQSRKQHKPQRAPTGRKKGYKLKLQKAKARERTIKGWKTKWQKAGGRKTGPQHFSARKALEVRKRKLFGIEEGGGWGDVRPEEGESIETGGSAPRRIHRPGDREELAAFGTDKTGHSEQSLEDLVELEKALTGESNTLGLEPGTSVRDALATLQAASEREGATSRSGKLLRTMMNMDPKTAEQFLGHVQKMQDRELFRRIAEERVAEQGVMGDYATHARIYEDWDAKHASSADRIFKNLGGILARGRTGETESLGSLIAHHVDREGGAPAGPGITLARELGDIANRDYSYKKAEEPEKRAALNEKEAKAAAKADVVEAIFRARDPLEVVKDNTRLKIEEDRSTGKFKVDTQPGNLKYVLTGEGYKVFKNSPTQVLKVADTLDENHKRIIPDEEINALADSIVKIQRAKSPEEREEAIRENRRITGRVSTKLQTTWETHTEDAAIELVRRDFIAEQLKLRPFTGDFAGPSQDPRFTNNYKPLKAEDYYSINEAGIGPETTGTARLGYEARSLGAKIQGKNFYEPKPRFFESARQHGALEKEMALNKLNAARRGELSAFFNVGGGRVTPGGKIGPRGDKDPLQTSNLSVTPNFLYEYSLNEPPAGKVQAGTVYPNDPSYGSTGRQLGEVAGFKGDQVIRFEQQMGDERKMLIQPWDTQTQFHTGKRQFVRGVDPTPTQKEHGLKPTDTVPGDWDEMQMMRNASGAVVPDEKTNLPRAEVRRVPRFEQGAVNVESGARVPLGYVSSNKPGIAKELFIERPTEVVQKLRESNQDKVTLTGASKETYKGYFQRKDGRDIEIKDKNAWNMLPDDEKASYQVHKDIVLRYVPPGSTYLKKDEGDIAFVTLGKKSPEKEKFGYNVGIRIDEDTDSKFADAMRYGVIKPIRYGEMARREPVEQAVTQIRKGATESVFGDQTLETLASSEGRKRSTASQEGFPVRDTPEYRALKAAGSQIDPEMVHRLNIDPGFRREVKEDYSRRYGTTNQESENHIKTIVAAGTAAGYYRFVDKGKGRVSNKINKTANWISKKAVGRDIDLIKGFDTTKDEILESRAIDAHNRANAIRGFLVPWRDTKGTTPPGTIVPKGIHNRETLIFPETRIRRRLEAEDYKLAKLTKTAESAREKATQPGIRGWFARQRIGDVKRYVDKQGDIASRDVEGRHISGVEAIATEGKRMAREIKNAPPGEVQVSKRSLFEVLQRKPKHQNVGRWETKQVISEQTPTGKRKITVTPDIERAGQRLEARITKPGGYEERLQAAYKNLDLKGVKAPPVFPNAIRWKSGNFNPNEKHVLVGAGIVGTAAGAAYLYHRHQEKKRKEADPTYQGKTWYNKVLPPSFKSPVPTPSWQTTKFYKVPSTEFNDYFRITGNEIPVGGRVHFNRKQITMRPMERKDVAGNTFSPTAGIGFPRVGIKPEKGFMKSFVTNPEADEAFAKGRKSFVPQGKELKVFGKNTPFFVDIGKEKEMKMKKSHKGKLTDKDREKIITSVVGTPQEKQVRDFFSFGTHDKIVDMMDDPQEVARIFRKEELSPRQLEKTVLSEAVQEENWARKEALKPGGEIPQAATQDERVAKLEAMKKKLASDDNLPLEAKEAIDRKIEEIRTENIAIRDLPGIRNEPWHGADFGSHGDEPPIGSEASTTFFHRPRQSKETPDRGSTHVSPTQLELFPGARAKQHTSAVDLEAGEAVRREEGTRRITTGEADAGGVSQKLNEFQKLFDKAQEDYEQSQEDEYRRGNY